MKKTSLSKILVVDDDLDILTIIKYILETIPGTTVKCVNSGEKAIKEALEFIPDIILLDIMMPHTDGISTLKSFRLIPLYAIIPVIFITGKAQTSKINEYLKLGVSAVIVKPFDPLTLGSIVQKIWNKHQK